MSRSSGSSCDLPLSTSWIGRRKNEHIKTQRRRDAEPNQGRDPGAVTEPDERSTSNVQRSTLKYAPEGGLLWGNLGRGSRNARPAPPGLNFAGTGCQPPSNRVPQARVSILDVGRWTLDVLVFYAASVILDLVAANSPLRLCVSASLRYFLLRQRSVSGDSRTFPLRFRYGQSAVAVGFVSLGLVIGALGCASSPKTVPTEPTKPRSEGWTEKGDASWYGKPYHGRRTASGEIYDMHQMTAAHRSLPFGTQVRVQRRDTGAEVEVRITDRGPFIKGRIIDLSFAAARVIGLDIDGVAPVKIKVLGQSGKPRSGVTAPLPQSSGGDQCLWVQVGAFSSSSNAKRAVERLKESGEKALAMEGPDGLERVRVGPFQSGKDAAEALRRLVDEWVSARIVECG